ncbi:hypothetical protein TCAL_03826, partial [Tigriopus californicus]
SFYDWDGKTLVYEHNFVENGIGCDAKTISGPQVSGIAAIGANLIAVGIHTGTILLFEISSDSTQLVCRIVDSQRRHIEPVSDVASTSMMLHHAEKSSPSEVLVSGDELGRLNIWNLGSSGDGLVHRTSIDPDEKTGPVTAICLWNKVEQGVILSGFMNGSIKLFSITSGKILVDIAAHGAWITGMDLASQSGVFVSCAEDGFIRVWQLSTTGKIIEHRHSKPIQNLVMAGVKFIDPRGVSLAMSSYDSRKIRIFSKKS